MYQRKVAEKQRQATLFTYASLHSAPENAAGTTLIPVKRPQRPLQCLCQGEGVGWENMQNVVQVFFTIISN